MPRSHNITLPDDRANLVDSKLALGEYADESEILCGGLRSLVTADDEIGQWLRDEVVPTDDRVKSGEAKLCAASEVFNGMQARYLARKAAPGK
jgi:Arc/MetJ-type ribon-helix-helix transcriptional regulator